MNKGLSIEDLRAMRTTVFAPMVQQLEINPVEITDTGARFEIPATDFVMRTGDIVCGQSIAAIADTVGVMALFAHNEEQRIMTTVDMTTHFMRPLSKGMIEAEAIIQSNGKRMANVRIEIRQQGSEKLAGTTTCAYVYV
ncbi:MAG: PaaI family thioesterase [Rhizobiaceae bacterium]|nr:PaaI family thioesterase [Rhizobiaceae bacterium]